METCHSSKQHHPSLLFVSATIAHGKGWCVCGGGANREKDGEVINGVAKQGGRVSFLCSL